MSKLQKQKAWKRGNKIYSKWAITIPDEEVQRAGLQEGDDLFIYNSGMYAITLVKKNVNENILSINHPHRRTKEHRKFMKAYHEYMEWLMSRRSRNRKV